MVENSGWVIRNDHLPFCFSLYLFSASFRSISQSTLGYRFDLLYCLDALHISGVDPNVLQFWIDDLYSIIVFSLCSVHSIVILAVCVYLIHAGNQRESPQFTIHRSICWSTSNTNSTTDGKQYLPANKNQLTSIYWSCRHMTVCCRNPFSVFVRNKNWFLSETFSVFKLESISIYHLMISLEFIQVWSSYYIK